MWFAYSMLDCTVVWLLGIIYRSSCKSQRFNRTRFTGLFWLGTKCVQCNVQLFDWLISFCSILLWQELNDYLAQRSYLVGQSLTLADVVVFYSMCAIMDSLNASDKEKYLNVSRWYEHLQKMGEIRQNLPLINLSTIYLHGWATGTHI